LSCFEQLDYPEDYNSVTAIVYGKGKFVAGFSGGKMSVSDNGAKSWQQVNNPFGVASVDAIAYGNGMFVACSVSEMAYSYNGEDWILVNNATFGESNINSICYGNDKFVAVGQNYINDYGKIAYSFNGIDWIATNASFVRYDDIRAIAYGNGKFITGSIYNKSSGKIACSSDGINWPNIQITTPIFSLSYGYDKFICGSIDKIIYSLDGLSWIENNNSFFKKNESIRSIAYGDGIYLAIGGGGSIAYSSNGIEWKKKIHSINTHGFLSAAYGDGKFLVGDWNGNITIFDISEFR